VVFDTIIGGLFMAITMVEVMGITTFSLGVMLVILGLVIIVLRGVIRGQLKTAGPVDAKEAGVWDAIVKLLEIILSLPVIARVAFTCIILGVALIVLGYAMIVGYCPL